MDSSGPIIHIEFPIVYLSRFYLKNHLETSLLSSYATPSIDSYNHIMGIGSGLLVQTKIIDLIIIKFL